MKLLDSAICTADMVGRPFWLNAKTNPAIEDLPDYAKEMETHLQKYGFPVPRLDYFDSRKVCEALINIDDQEDLYDVLQALVDFERFFHITYCSNSTPETEIEPIMRIINGARYTPFLGILSNVLWVMGKIEFFLGIPLHTMTQSPPNDYNNYFPSKDFLRCYEYCILFIEKVHAMAIANQKPTNEIILLHNKILRERRKLPMTTPCGGKLIMKKPQNNNSSQQKI